MTSKAHITIAGVFGDPIFFVYKSCAEELATRYSSITFESVLYPEADWRDYLKSAIFKFGSSITDDMNAFVFYNGSHFIADILKWAAEFHQINFIPNYDQCKKQAEEAFQSWMNEQENSYCCFDLEMGDRPLGKVYFELFEHICPKTCANFRSLCSGDHNGSNGKPLHYKGTPLHRVVRDGWVQGGDILSGRGDQSESIYGPTFEDENLSITHRKPGMLGMARGDDHHTNGSQFYITLSPLPWLDYQRVVFGRVIQGIDLLRSLQDSPCPCERPRPDCVIRDCAVLSPPGKHVV